VPKIAISYRRADTEVIAGRIRDRLAARYGDDAVFMDIDNIPFGKDFRVHIREVIVQSDILLVIVGPRWLGASRSRSRRIDDETDFVRLEVETALSNTVSIIPVLVGAARMPQPAQLPESLKNFVFLNAAPVDTGRDFHQHMERLIRGIDEIPDRPATSPATSGSRNEVASAAAPASASRDADADMADFAVFRDALSAPEMVVLPAGEFLMGSPEGEEGRYPNEGPQHRVAFGRRFAIGKYPVTFDEYDRFCEATGRGKPSDEGWDRGRWPVINVSRQDARDYIAWLSHETGRAYRLPSEAEWEDACRAGTTTRYSVGDAIMPSHANYGELGSRRTSGIDFHLANPWGLHDMHGNVWEWIEDDWHENYQGAPGDGSAWKDTEAGRAERLCVLRGGSWGNDSGLCRSAFRRRSDCGLREAYTGFRVARTLS
jgi:formylglycine-generating enzyme required for sulfatase activity